MSKRTIRLNGQERYYVVLRSEDGQEFRVPCLSQPEITWSNFDPPEIRGVLLPIEGVVAISPDGAEQTIPVQAPAWLRSETQAGADNAQLFEALRRR